MINELKLSTIRRVRPPCTGFTGEVKLVSAPQVDSEAATGADPELFCDRFTSTSGPKPRAPRRSGGRVPPEMLKLRVASGAFSCILRQNLGFFSH